MTDSSGLIDDNDVFRSSDAYLARVKDAKLRAQLVAIGGRVRVNLATEASPLWLIRLAAWQPLLSARPAAATTTPTSVGTSSG
jgi:hypothetical protein